MTQNQKQSHYSSQSEYGQELKKIVLGALGAGVKRGKTCNHRKSQETCIWWQAREMCTRAKRRENIYGTKWEKLVAGAKR